MRGRRKNDWDGLQIRYHLTINAHANGFELTVEKAFYQFQLHHAYGKLPLLKVVPGPVVLIL